MWRFPLLSVDEEPPGMAATTKKVLLWLLLAFVVYTIIVNPAKAAGMVRETFQGISVAGESLGDFFDALV
jgi:hypothetical protein